MERAVEIGSIVMDAAQDPEIKQRFMALMQDAFVLLLPFPVNYWNPPQSAPEGEKGGTA
jgi:hypothetical protein